ncbi:hypothetical protein ERIC1_1c32930 [Paenibacillus larvae subsp. larvae DSM 25719]|uniref:Uncharacterized protein n=1 Tax=Paenibacillus larvae subsp. larvae DSM 25430 TaxID=697284 RepID=V9W8A6_9BACL|nr:hypothetical protein ERIC2_c35281 [Paenibacillus larvae subsp. larvae DSM 25430]ETK29734.1 hypothetical protein ERIC1_1c32930 [Paenibacillus larvae subsp. larvae DSM 25719]
MFIFPCNHTILYARGAVDPAVATYKESSFGARRVYCFSCLIKGVENHENTLSSEWCFYSDRRCEGDAHSS